MKINIFYKTVNILTLLLFFIVFLDYLVKFCKKLCKKLKNQSSVVPAPSQGIVTISNHNIGGEAPVQCINIKFNGPEIKHHIR